MKLHQLAKKGHQLGTLSYADALSKGDGVKKDEEKAFVLYQRCAKNGLRNAFSKLASLYARGIGTPKVGSSVSVQQTDVFCERILEQRCTGIIKLPILGIPWQCRTLAIYIQWEWMQKKI